MQKVIMLAPYFYPAFKAGGPAVTCTSLALCLSPSMDVSVITSKRDIDRTRLYFNKSDLAPADLTYISCGKFSVPFVLLFELIKARGKATISINAFYDPFSSLIPLLLCLFFPRAKLIVSIRGQLFEAAVSNKKKTKKIYMNVFRFFLFLIRKRSILHLTSVHEENRVRALFGEEFQYMVVPNLPDFRLLQERDVLPSGERESRTVKRVLSVGRVSPIKNYELLLHAAQHFKGIADFIVVGPIENKQYYSQLMEIMCRLDIDNVQFVGEKDRESLLLYYCGADIYFHPALSENFCHSAVEAMLNGLPIVMSSGLPWLGVSDFGGQVVDPENLEEAVAALSALLCKKNKELTAIGVRCRDYILSELDLDSSRKAYIGLFSS
ncbi:glycosyltransferase family 4 protein [Isoalcanivorax pacificus]|nr:glycosyltransferase family 4 protein [Isoalcanivorax pacificus]